MKLDDKDFYIKCVIQVLNTILVVLVATVAFVLHYIDTLSTKTWGVKWHKYHPESINVFMFVTIVIYVLSTFFLWHAKFEYGRTISVSGAAIIINIMVGVISYWLYWQGFPLYCL